MHSPKLICHIDRLAEVSERRDKNYFWAGRACILSAESDAVRVHPPWNFNLLLLSHSPLTHMLCNFAGFIADILLISSVAPKLNTFCHAVGIGSTISPKQQWKNSKYVDFYSILATIMLRRIRN